MTAAVSSGFVLDFQGDLMPHPNGSSFVRVVVSDETADELWHLLLHRNHKDDNG